jgi:hypothetical protein
MRGIVKAVHVIDLWPKWIKAALLGSVLLTVFGTLAMFRGDVPAWYVIFAAVAGAIAGIVHSALRSRMSGVVGRLACWVVTAGTASGILILLPTWHDILNPTGLILWLAFTIVGGLSAMLFEWYILRD